MHTKHVDAFEHRVLSGPNPKNIGDLALLVDFSTTKYKSFDNFPSSIANILSSSTRCLNFVDKVTFLVYEHDICWYETHEEHGNLKEHVIWRLVPSLCGCESLFN
mgnify:CR=1 FL=1